MKTVNRLKKYGNFADADVNVDDVIMMLNDDEDYIQSLENTVNELNSKVYKIDAGDTAAKLKIIKLEKSVDFLKSEIAKRKKNRKEIVNNLKAVKTFLKNCIRTANSLSGRIYENDYEDAFDRVNYLLRECV